MKGLAERQNCENRIEEQGRAESCSSHYATRLPHVTCNGDQDRETNNLKRHDTAEKKDI